MDLNAFWALVERSAVETSGQDERLEWLTAAQAGADACEFALRVDTWALWQAADVIGGGPCSDDRFFCFQAWLVGQGREVFEAVGSSLDALAEVPHVRLPASRGGVHAGADEDWPNWEGLDHVAAEVFGGELEPVLAARGVKLLVSPDPVGE